MLTKLIKYYKTGRMFNTSFNQFLLFGTLLVASLPQGATAKEGPGTSGGGGGVACVDDVLSPKALYRDFFRPSYQPKGPAKFVYVLDYFQSKLPNTDGVVAPSIFDDKKLTETQAIELFLKEIGRYGSVADNLRESIENTIGPIGNWTDSPLDEYADSGKAYKLPKGCRYVQLALRQNDVMYGDSEWIRKLSPAQRGVLRIHESVYLALYASASTVNGAAPVLTSVPVRQLIGALAHILPVKSPEYYARSAKVRKMLANSFGSLKPVLAPVTAQPFGVGAIKFAVYGSGDISLYGRCERSMKELVDRMNRSIDMTGMDLNDTDDVIVKLTNYTQDEKNGLCITDAYVLTSPWDHAFKTLIGAVHSDIEFELTRREGKPEFKKTGFNGYLSMIEKFLVSAKPQLEKMKDFDSALYQGTIETINAIKGQEPKTSR